MRGSIDNFTRLKGGSPLKTMKKPQNAQKTILMYLIVLEIIFQNLFKVFKNISSFKSYSRPKFGVSQVLILNNRRKITENNQKIGKIYENRTFNNIK